MKTPSPGSPADSESIQRSSGRLVCLPGILTLSDVVFPERNTDTLEHSWPRGLCKYMPRSLEPSCLSPGWDMIDISELSLVVIDNVTQARAPSMRHLYAFKWCLFAEGRLTEMHSRISASFLQKRLGGGCPLHLKRVCGISHCSGR